MDLLCALVAISLLPISGRAHMQMSNPFPINSPLNSATPEDLKDYDYTSPLLSDRSNYPCKSYQSQSTSYDNTATYTAGLTYNMSIAGTVNHGGGSCQLSLSYDNGQTFKVIKSMIGGCPITTTYNFTIPSFAPSSQSALFAWTWFNEIGNREMYMNCARVEILAAVPGRHRRAQEKRQDPMSSLPDLFVCNINNGCTTIEQEDVQFPDPGPNVVYGSDDPTYPPNNGPGFATSGDASNSTVLTTTTSSSYPTSGPYTNATTTASSMLSPNTATSTSTITTESTSILLLTDFITMATTILVTSTPSSLSASSTDLVSSVIVATVTVPSTAFVSPTPSLFPSTFSNATSLASTPVNPSSRSPIFLNTTSSPPSFSATLSELSTSSDATTLPTLFTTTLSATSLTVPVLSTITSTATTLSSSASPLATLLTGPCVPGAFACNSPLTFSQCMDGVGGIPSYIYMGSVAAGMECSNGQIVRENAGACTPNGQLFCHGESTFYLCDDGGLINMGPVAPGTVCMDGVIGYPPSKR